MLLGEKVASYLLITDFCRMINVITQGNQEWMNYFTAKGKPVVKVKIVTKGRRNVYYKN
jgi:hypothetical protein